jgi:hypothetical protein
MPSRLFCNRYVKMIAILQTFVKNFHLQLLCGVLLYRYHRNNIHNYFVESITTHLRIGHNYNLRDPELTYF